ncbi:SDR family NAD(P)-dependent oxidoreductase [Dysgonomonas sp. 511]|uniref:SDR family NAD(P)-dependent oxidoreductase n=1 Tax=Dysgonomonas sp. 511 TaxID=2302930 RepID=UPI0013D234E7|nr:SDR family oxidoreductase [Dysgonomonas sp. 511]NDV79730.1 SDR family oxidoreductase [Dysgonomonas sp. 511]
MNKIEELYSLNGRVAVVTGASSGLGLNQAIMLAECGAKVFALSRSGKPKVDIDREIPDTIEFRQMDVSDEQNIKDVLSDIGTNHGIDILVNNAGITKRVKAQEVTTEEWDAIHQVNVTGVFNCCKYAYLYLKESQYTGRIINISSMASYLGFSEVTPYCSSKSAVLGITRGLAVEWRNDNILVNSVSPGWFPSQMSQQVMDEDRKQKILNRMPLHRFGHPDELSPIICFLASAGASYITGQDFSVDGGAMAFGF